MENQPETPSFSDLIADRNSLGRCCARAASRKDWDSAAYYAKQFDLVDQAINRQLADNAAKYPDLGLISRDN